MYNISYIAISVCCERSLFIQIPAESSNIKKARRDNPLDVNWIPEIIKYPVGETHFAGENICFTEIE